MDNTSRVAQWRQKMRDEGKEALTVWLSRDVKLRLEDLAATWHTTTSEMVEQALAHFHPGSPQRISNDTDAAQLQGLIEDRLRAMLPGLKEQILQEVRGEMSVAVMNGNVTVTEVREPSQRRGGRRRSAVGQQILDTLAQHPEGLTAAELRTYVKATKPIGDTLAGMRRLRTVKTQGKGQATRYFVGQ